MMPAVKWENTKALARYRFGQYVAVLVKDPETVGPIQYPFMLVFGEPGSRGPSLIVTCEVADSVFWALQKRVIEKATRAALGEQAPAFLCYFNAGDDGPHVNVEQFTNIPDAETFTAKAFALAKRVLRVAEDPIAVNQPKTTRSGFMWVALLLGAVIAIPFKIGSDAVPERSLPEPSSLNGTALSSRYPKTSSADGDISGWDRDKNIREAVEKFSKTIKSNGMSGSKFVVTDCYAGVDHLPSHSLKKLKQHEYCMAIDLAAHLVDDAAVKQYQFPPDEYFTVEKVSARVGNLGEWFPGSDDKSRFVQIVLNRVNDNLTKLAD